jgi:hypothetical protein
MKALFVAAEMRLIHDVDRSVDLDADVNVIASIGVGQLAGRRVRGSSGVGRSGVVGVRAAAHEVRDLGMELVSRGTRLLRGGTATAIRCRRR